MTFSPHFFALADGMAGLGFRVQALGLSGTAAPKGPCRYPALWKIMTMSLLSGSMTLNPKP